MAVARTQSAIAEGVGLNGEGSKKVEQGSPQTQGELHKEVERLDAYDQIRRPLQCMRGEETTEG